MDPLAEHQTADVGDDQLNGAACCHSQYDIVGVFLTCDVSLPTSLDGHDCSCNTHVDFRLENELILLEECLEWLHVSEFVELLAEQCPFQDARLKGIKLFLLLFILVIDR